MKHLSKFCRLPKGIDWRVLVLGAIYAIIQGTLLAAIPYDDSRFLALVLVRSILALIFVTVLAYALERR